MPKIKKQRSAIMMALFVLTGIFFLAMFYFKDHKVKEFFKLKKKSVDGQASIAVLPFVNMSNDPDQDYFSDGLTDGILNSLAHLEGLKVSSRNSSFKFRGKDVDIQEVGRKLGVRTILEGSVHRQGDRIRITAQLINVEDDFHFWSEQYDEKWEDVFELQDEIANSIAKKLKITLLENEQVKATKKPTPKKEAYEAYLKGRVHWNLRTPQDLTRAIELFEEAIRLDSSYAAAYSGLADSYNAIGYGSYRSPKETFLKGKQAATKALHFDSLSAESHASLGFFNFYYAWDWEAAEQEFRTAIALNPNYALAYDWYGYYLTAMERYDEAKIIFQKAESIDPLSVSIHTDMGFSLYYSGDYTHAIQKLKSSIEMNPRFGAAHLWLGRAYQQQKMYDSAVLEYERILIIQPEWPVALAAIGHVYGMRGDQKNAKNILETMHSLSTKKFVTAYGMALVYAGLNDRDETFEWLTKAYEERSHWLVWLKTDPRWNSIRNEKQYIEFVSRIGLPQ